MKKQTVAERFAQEQAMRKPAMPMHDINLLVESKEKQSLQKLFSEVKVALASAHQAVRQAQAANPVNETLQMADERLTFASTKIATLQTAVPALTSGLSRGVKQQITQLENQIEQAAGTLQLIQQSLEVK